MCIVYLKRPLYILYTCSIGGYEYTFFDAVHHDDYCVICRRPAQDPQQTKCDCAKVYCKSCYDGLKRNYNTALCPTCYQALDAFSDKKTARRIREYKIKCTSTNCPWVNELKLIDDHLTICGYVLVPCANGCRASITRDNAITHQTKECPLRQHTCEHCRARGTFVEMTGAHILKCPDYLIPCPNRGCGMKVKRKETDTHRSECPYEIIDCPYKMIGCAFKSMRSKIADHKATSTEYHLELSMAQIMKQKEQQIELTKTIVTLEQEKPHWVTMTKFTRFKIDKKEWYSEGFYTHIHGYKLCLRVDANGNDEGAGKYVSAYLCLTEGEYDADLTWPMNCECTLTLLNQLKDDDHHIGTFTLTINEMHERRSAMLVGENGRRRGYHRFIAHSLLDQRMLKQCQYLMDDTLRFKIQVKVIFSKALEDSDEEQLTYTGI